MIQDKVHSVKTEQEKCSVFFCTPRSKFSFHITRNGLSKKFYHIQSGKCLVKELHICYNRRCRV